MNKRFLRAAMTATVLALTGSFAGQTAQATTFAEMTTEQFTDASTWIIEGQVVEVWTELDAKRQHVLTKARVSVSETLKGPGHRDELVVTTLGGTYGAIRTDVDGRAVFSVGEDVFLFLHENSRGELRPVSKFLGKYSIRRAPGESRMYVRRWHPTADLAYDHRFVPHPTTGELSYLDALKASVQDRLDQGWDGKAIPGLQTNELEIINAPTRRMPR